MINETYVRGVRHANDYGQNVLSRFIRLADGPPNSICRKIKYWLFCRVNQPQNLAGVIFTPLTDEFKRVGY